MIRSLRGRLVALWLASVTAALVTGGLLIALYRQSAVAQVERTEAVVARACGDIASHSAALATVWPITSGGPLGDDVRRQLAAILQKPLAEAHGVEGGIWQAGAGSLAYAYPTYEGSGPKTDVPPAELEAITHVNSAALAQGRPVAWHESGPSQSLLLHACPLPGPIPGLTAWTMARVFTGAGRTFNQLLLGLGVLLVTIVGSAVWLGQLVLTWSRQLTRIETTLARHAGEDLPALTPTGERELDRIVTALNGTGNRLAELRQRSEEMTRRAAAAERLAALGRVAAGIAHEIRNPIAAMRLKAENALAGDDERRRAALPAILEQIQRLDHLLRDLLAMTHRAAPRPRPVDLPAFLDECIATHRDLADARGVALRCTCDVPRAQFDPEQLRGALDNLVLNALQHTPAAGTVAVTATRDGDRLRFQVADTGSGVPEDIRNQLFEPFVTGRADGTGLGLASVREVARAHGGDARLASSECGAILEIELPWRPS